MKTSSFVNGIHWWVAIILLALAAITGGMGQENSTPAYDRTELMKIAREIMEQARYCALITLDDSGHPQARILDPFAPDENFVVWLGTNPRTRKVKQIKKDPRVTLFYFDKESLGYVTLIGRARLVNDPREKQRRWKEGWERFYPDREKDYLLIEVTPERLEVISVQHNISGDSVTWKPPVIEMNTRE